MSLNLLPARVPIGKVSAPDGRTLDVLMTTEFSRALSDLLARIGGADGVSTTELARMIKEVQQQSITFVQQITALFDLAQKLTQELEDQAVLQAMEPIPVVTPPQSDELAMLLAGTAPTMPTSRIDDLELLAILENRPVVQKNTVTGSRGGNLALASLLSALSKSNLITDATT